MNMKQFISIILALALSASSALAVTTSEQISATETSAAALSKPITNLKILSFKSDHPQKGAHCIHLNINLTTDRPTEDFCMRILRTANGKTTDITNRRNVRVIENRYSSGSYEIDDHTAKNGTYYTYQLVGATYDKETDIYAPYLYSNKLSLYYLRSSFESIIIKNSSSGKTMTISWERNSKADGYQIQYATKEDLSNRITRKVTKNNQTSLKLSNRTPGKQYWVRVRSYKKYKGKTWYSAWSGVYPRYWE